MSIRHLLHIYRWKKFGKNSKVIRPMRIFGEDNISIGNNVRIFNDARLEAITNWRGKTLHGELLIGDNTSIEQRVHIVAADRLEIGHDVTISANVYISDCAHAYGNNTNAINASLDIKATKIGNYVFIGYGACVMPGVTIGDNVIIGANAVVTHDCMEGCIYAGVPAKEISKIRGTGNE